MDAQRALDSLLGSLSNVLVNEAQLLGGVRGDVEFIKDEMESMNGLLLHLTEAQNRDQQVRAWMKQIVGLTRDCEGNVELYIHYVGTASGGKGSVFGYLWRIPQFLRTIRVRHQIATRIRELKVRAHDVGQRRLRYGVTVPVSDKNKNLDDDIADPGGYLEEWPKWNWQTLIIDNQHPDDWKRITEQENIGSLFKCLSEEPPPVSDGSTPRPRVIGITGEEANAIASKAYHHCSVQSLFNLSLGEYFLDSPGHIMNQMAQVTGLHGENEDDLKLQEHLKGKRFLILLKNYTSWRKDKVAELFSLFRAGGGCHRASAILVTTSYGKDTLNKELSPDRILTCEPYFNTMCDRAKESRNLGIRLSQDSMEPYKQILDNLCNDIDFFAAKIFLHLIYVKPNREREELDKYLKIIGECKLMNKSIAKQMVMFCYNELPTKYRSCLLYLTIFPKGHTISASSLARRWIAEGLVAASSTGDDDTMRATTEAECYLDVLVKRGFLYPEEISPTGSIKKFKVHDEVHKIISMAARDVNFLDPNLPLNLARHLSIHNRVVLQADDDNVDIVALLPTMASSFEWQVLKVLDLGGCKLSEKHHLEIICKILLLRYLSLRNTNVSDLPEKIKKLQCLETLDIRQTKVRELSKAIVLPKLKHFHAGYKVSSSNEAGRCQKSFYTVEMPVSIGRMRNLEILSHVHVTNNNRDLAGIGQLLKLRKLGVYLRNDKLNDLIHKIEPLHGCLRSLSIRIDQSMSSEHSAAGIPDALRSIPQFIQSATEMVHRCFGSLSIQTDQPANPEDHAALPSLPQFIESLNICGITDQPLLHLIQDHHRLVNVTLSETLFKENVLCILGELSALRSLRLQDRSYDGSVLTFQYGKFRNLKFLFVEGNEITKICFDVGACSGLERIIWSSANMAEISGIGNLSCLKKLELKGNYNNLDQVTAAIFQRDKQFDRILDVMHNPDPGHQGKEDGTAAVATTSSAP